MKTGDIVLIQDSNLIRGQWKLGKVSNTYPGTDGKVRKVDVQYKNLNADEPTAKYKGKGYVTVQRPVQRLLLNSQPRIMHFACSDWFTQSRLSAHIPWFDLIW